MFLKRVMKGDQSVTKGNQFVTNGHFAIKNMDKLVERIVSAQYMSNQVVNINSIRSAI